MRPLGKNDPKEIGEFSLAARLGSGGMGVVYLARRGVQHVALKVLNSALVAEPSQRERFSREAEALERLDSDHVARLVDWSVEQDEAWLALEYVSGPTLRELVRHVGAVSPEIWLGLARGMALALEEFHSKGIVHRDIKPSNVVLSKSGPKIIDFGIAQVLDATRLTKTGTVEGSPAWLSPEQLEAESFGPQSDIFSLASTLVYAASSRSPWGNEDTLTVPVVFSRILSHQPDLSGLSERQARLVTPMLEKDPDARPSATELVSQLDGVDMTIFRDDSWLSARREAQADSDKAELATPTPGLATGNTRVMGYPSLSEDDEKTETITSGRATRPVGKRPTQAGAGAGGARGDTAVQGITEASTGIGAGVFRGLLAVAALLTLAVPFVAGWTWVSGSQPQPAELPGIELQWVDGDLYPAGDSTLQAITSPERLLEDYYVVSDEFITRSACLPEEESDDYVFGQPPPMFEVLGPAGTWEQVAEGQFLGPSNCPDGHRLTEVSLPAEILSRWDLVEECTMYRYREPATLNFAERFEQWCVTFQ